VDLWNPFVYGDYIYVGNHGLDGGELKILDASNPSEITEIGTYDEGSQVSGAYVIGTIAYVADYLSGLIILDVSTPSNPIKIGSYYDGGGGYGVFTVNNIVYVADHYDGLEIIQVLDNS
jgi:hypothetical protein